MLELLASLQPYPLAGAWLKSSSEISKLVSFWPSSPEVHSRSSTPSSSLSSLLSLCSENGNVVRYHVLYDTIVSPNDDSCGAARRTSSLLTTGQER